MKEAVYDQVAGQLDASQSARLEKVRLLEQMVLLLVQQELVFKPELIYREQLFFQQMQL